MAAAPEREKNLAAVMLGRLGGRVRSKAQQAASVRNIAKANRRWAAKKRKAAR
jgi:hypothetical protein